MTYNVLFSNTDYDAVTSVILRNLSVRRADSSLHSA